MLFKTIVVALSAIAVAAQGTTTPPSTITSAPSGATTVPPAGNALDSCLSTCGNSASKAASCKPGPAADLSCTCSNTVYQAVGLSCVQGCGSGALQAGAASQAAICAGSGAAPASASTTTSASAATSKSAADVPFDSSFTGPLTALAGVFLAVLGARFVV